jgi:hypothetical protein
VDVRSFLRLFDVENRAPQLAAIAPLTAIRAMRSSLVSGFDSFKPGGVVPGIFDNLTAERAAELAKMLGIKAETLSGTPHERPDPYSALLASMIHRGADPLAFFEQGDRVTAATRVMTAPAGPISQLEERMKKLEEEIRTLRNLHQPPNDQQGGPGGNH